MLQPVDFHSKKSCLAEVKRDQFMTIKCYHFRRDRMISRKFRIDTSPSHFRSSVHIGKSRLPHGAELLCAHGSVQQRMIGNGD